MAEISIRDAVAADAAIIAEFNTRMAMETEGRPLDSQLINAGVSAVLQDPALGRYWVADAGGEVVGQLLITFEWSDWRNGRFWWIQSVYVRDDYRRGGVFSALYRHVEKLARQTGDVCGLRLYVERHNRRARDTYLGLGMRAPGYLVMEVDFRKDDQDLCQTALARGRGRGTADGNQADRREPFRQGYPARGLEPVPCD